MPNIPRVTNNNSKRYEVSRKLVNKAKKFKSLQRHLAVVAKFRISYYFFILINNLNELYYISVPCHGWVCWRRGGGVVLAGGEFARCAAWPLRTRTRRHSTLPIRSSHSRRSCICEYIFK